MSSPERISDPDAGYDGEHHHRRNPDHDNDQHGHRHPHHNHGHHERASSPVRTLSREEINRAHTHAWNYFVTLNLPHPPTYFTEITYCFTPEQGAICSFRVNTTPPISITVSGSLDNPTITHRSL